MVAIAKSLQNGYGNSNGTGPTKTNEVTNESVTVSKFWRDVLVVSYCCMHRNFNAVATGVWSGWSFYPMENQYSDVLTVDLWFKRYLLNIVYFILYCFTFNASHFYGDKIQRGDADGIEDKLNKKANVDRLVKCCPESVIFVLVTSHIAYVALGIWTQTLFSTLFWLIGLNCLNLIPACRRDGFIKNFIFMPIGLVTMIVSPYAIMLGKPESMLGLYNPRNIIVTLTTTLITPLQDFRDFPGDSATGRNTLQIKYGMQKCKRVFSAIIAMVIIIFLVLPETPEFYSQPLMSYTTYKVISTAQMTYTLLSLWFERYRSSYEYGFYLWVLFQFAFLPKLEGY